MFLTSRLPESVLKVVGRPMLQAQKHSPIILFTAGVVGAVGSTVLACRATLKLDDILTEAAATAELIESVVDHPDYSDRDKAKDKAKLRVKTGVAVTKLYGPAILMGLTSVGLLTGSHYIMSSRQAGLMAAYAALDKGYSEYQARVRAEFGAEKEEELRFGSVITKVKDEEGKTVKVTRADPNAYSPYARFFDESAKEWNREPSYNYLALRSKQAFANNLLHAQGHIFLNEVYDMLGLERTRAGAVVGWVIDPEGDNFVDFGIFNGDSPAVRDFVNGNEGSILLDFNVNGVIIDKI
jgi:hypothetical protein